MPASTWGSPSNGELTPTAPVPGYTGRRVVVVSHGPQVPRPGTRGYDRAVFRERSAALHRGDPRRRGHRP